MSLTTCRECGHQISSTARACPNCGAKIPRSKWWLWLPLAGIASFLTFGALLPEDPKLQAQQAEREAIKQCWKAQRSPSLPPGIARAAATRCEAMEREYVQQWGRAP